MRALCAATLLALVGCDWEAARRGACLRVDGGCAETDAGTQDAGTQDAGTQDAGTQDAGAMDAGSSDAGPTVDAGSIFRVLDAGPVEPIGLFPNAARNECWFLGATDAGSVMGRIGADGGLGVFGVVNTPPGVATAGYADWDYAPDLTILSQEGSDSVLSFYRSGSDVPVTTSTWPGVQGTLLSMFTSSDGGSLYDSVWSDSQGYRQDFVRHASTPPMTLVNETCVGLRFHDIEVLGPLGNDSAVLGLSAPADNCPFLQGNAGTSVERITSDGLRAMVLVDSTVHKIVVGSTGTAGAAPFAAWATSPTSIVVQGLALDAGLSLDPARRSVFQLLGGNSEVGDLVKDATNLVFTGIGSGVVRLDGGVMGILPTEPTAFIAQVSPTPWVAALGPANTAGRSRIAAVELTGGLILVMWQLPDGQLAFARVATNGFIQPW